MTIPASELSSIRAEAGKYLVQRARIRRKNVVSDGRGGQIEDWYDLAVDVPCRLDDGSGTEATVGDRRTAVRTWRGKFPYDQDLRTTDQVVVDGEIYEVTYAQRRPYDAYRQADLVRA